MVNRFFYQNGKQMTCALLRPNAYHFFMKKKTNKKTFQVFLSLCLSCVMCDFFSSESSLSEFILKSTGVGPGVRENKRHTWNEHSSYLHHHDINLNTEILLSGLSDDFRFQLATPHSRLISLKNNENISKLHFDRSRFLTCNALSYYAQRAHKPNKRRKIQHYFVRRWMVNSFTLICTAAWLHKNYLFISTVSVFIIFISNYP